MKNKYKIPDYKNGKTITEVDLNRGHEYAIALIMLDHFLNCFGLFTVKIFCFLIKKNLSSWKKKIDIITSGNSEQFENSKKFKRVYVTSSYFTRSQI